MKTNLTIGLALALITALLLLLPRKQDLDSQYEGLIEKLNPYQFRRLHRFFEENVREKDSEFWAESGRVYGLWERWENMTVLVRMCILAYRQGAIDRADAVELIGEANAFTFFTLLALPEAALCVLWRTIPHVCARTAAEFYRSFAPHAYNSCCRADGPECVTKMGKLL